MNTTITVDPKLKDLLLSLKEINTAIRDEAWKETLKISTEMEAQIKDTMPVDTGRARAGWGRWTPEDLQGLKKPPSKNATRLKATGGSKRVQVASSGDAVWEEDESNLSIMQGTNVPYTQYLNDGHSSQAPMNFIDDAIEAAEGKVKELSDRLGERAEAVFKRQGTTSPTVLKKYQPRGARAKAGNYVERYRKALGQVEPSKKKPIKRKK